MLFEKLLINMICDEIKNFENISNKNMEILHEKLTYGIYNINSIINKYYIVL